MIVSILKFEKQVYTVGRIQNLSVSFLENPP